MTGWCTVQGGPPQPYIDIHIRYCTTRQDMSMYIHMLDVYIMKTLVGICTTARRRVREDAFYGKQCFPFFSGLSAFCRCGQCSCVEVT